MVIHFMALNAQNTAKRSNNKRERILNGALKAFAKKGFYNTRISEIAVEAGVADGTIYLYFKNKDDLLISLFEDRMDWLNQRMERELADLSCPKEKIKKIIELHCLLALDDPDLAEFITVELRQSSKFVKEYENPKFHNYLRILEGVLNEGQPELFQSDLNIRLIARAIFGALDEVLLILTLGQIDPSEFQIFIKQLTAFVLGGISRTKE